MASLDVLAKNLFIEASAGSGKTYQLGNRIISRIAAGISPPRVAALTFTRKAAGEFTDSVLTKLADAAEDPVKGERLRVAIRQSGADFPALLASVVRSLPSMMLGTIDGFFSRIVRSFPYELGLTGGRFSLLEGPQAEASLEELLVDILGEILDGKQAEEFLLSYRRASIGKETGRVSSLLRKYADTWYGVYRSKPRLAWAPGSIPSLAVSEWEKNREIWAHEAWEKWLALGLSEKLSDSVAKDLKKISLHTVGSGSINDLSTASERIRESASYGETGEMELSYNRKIHVIPAPVADILRRLFTRAAAAETGAALVRTRAIRILLDHYDKHRETLFRRHGKLSFADVKHLMSAWTFSEENRLRRELVDFRFDETIHHWLLDEFQDTSRSDWAGLSPLLEEAFTREDASVFIVGDRKQAIYGWRGGDVGLFDEIISRYSDDDEGNPDRLVIETMAESRRSCPAVLDLVNKVCGNLHAVSSIYTPGVSRRWKWEVHVSAAPEITGESRVIPTKNEEDRFAKLSELLAAHEIGKREITCGILLRSNDQVKAYAEFLRQEGYDVVEDGARSPAQDSVSGVALHQLLRWLADPSDVLARGVLSLSPFSRLMEETAGEDRITWLSLTTAISRSGYALAIAHLVDLCQEAWSAYEKRRARDVLDALAACDVEGVTSATRVAEHIYQLTVSQSPGVAAIQVMTIHKAKGLGFDMVVVPEISSKTTPNAGDFQIAITEEWVMDPPPRWARAFIPELAEAEEIWTEAQRYEDLCVLYVALTRAKRGLYVFLPEFSSKHDYEKPSPANLFAAALYRSSGDCLFQCGHPLWHETTGFREETLISSPAVVLPPPVPFPARIKLSDVSIHTAGVAFGSEVHAFLWRIGWADEAPAFYARGSAADAVSRLLAEPSLALYFHRTGRNISLLREQPVDALLDGKFISGIIDRLHLHRDETGTVSRVEIIDYKTDTVASSDELLSRHRPQLEAYRAAIAKMYPDVPVDCVIVSVHHKSAIIF